MVSLLHPTTIFAPTGIIRPAIDNGATDTNMCTSILEWGSWAPREAVDRQIRRSSLIFPTLRRLDVDLDVHASLPPEAPGFQRTDHNDSTHFFPNSL
jgi:hypothetical protein